MAAARSVRPVFWFGGTKTFVSGLHEDIRDTIGQSLFEAQRGGKHSSAKPLRGFGDARVLEIVADHSGDTFRVVYTVRWPERVWVLHVFQKKSKVGIKTPKSELDLIDARLRQLRDSEASGKGNGDD